MPPEWEGLEAGEKAGEREQGAEVCSGDRDIEAWGWKEEEGRSEETGIQWSVEDRRQIFLPNILTFSRASYLIYVLVNIQPPSWETLSSKHVICCCSDKLKQPWQPWHPDVFPLYSLVWVPAVQTLHSLEEVSTLKGQLWREFEKEERGKRNAG